MDATEREKLVARIAELNSFSANTLQEVLAKQAALAEDNLRLENFVNEDAVDDAWVNEWRNASISNPLSRQGQSSFASTTLPTVPRTQNRRVRLEQTDFLLIRQPVFSQYENAVMLDQQRKFFGLTGPQGFGKSAFLHYLATKHCYGGDFLVVYIPDCPATTEIAFKQELAKVFYQGCTIAGLTGYKIMNLLDELEVLLNKCLNFAASNGKTMLLLIDQMKLTPEALFHSIIQTVGSLRGSLRGAPIKVIMSSSISNRVSSIFGNGIHHLDPYAPKVTDREAIILASQPTPEGINVSAETLSGLSFLVATEKLKGTETSLVDLAASLADHLLQDPGDVSKQQAYFYLLMVADGVTTINEADCNFGSTLEGDQFYVEKDLTLGRYHISEHRAGYAAATLEIMRSSRYGDYKQYLLQVVSDPNFTTCDPGVRGRIVEDCFFCFAAVARASSNEFCKAPWAWGHKSNVHCYWANDSRSGCSRRG